MTTPPGWVKVKVGKTSGNKQDELTTTSGPEKRAETSSPLA